MSQLRFFSVAIALAALSIAAQAQDRFNQPPQPGFPQGQQGFPQQPQPGLPQGQQGFPQQPQPGFPQGQQGFPQQPQPGGFGQRPGFGAAPQAQIPNSEMQDFGVPPQSRLHAGAMHNPTPTSIPGGQVITTQGLIELMRTRQTPFLLLDILGGPQILPGAVYAVPAHQPGTFNDGTQQEFGNFLQQATQGNKQYPIVTYCESNYCWMSYNAALRAINMGYTNVLWYRGGIAAWQAAGQQLQYAQ